MAPEPCWEILENKSSMEGSVSKLMKAINDIGIPEFGTPDGFVELHEIIKSHTKQDSLWAKILVKVIDTMSG
jgi:hypothetical protein